MLPLHSIPFKWYYVKSDSQLQNVRPGVFVLVQCTCTCTDVLVQAVLVQAVSGVQLLFLRSPLTLFLLNNSGSVEKQPDSGVEHAEGRPLEVQKSNTPEFFQIFYKANERTLLF